MAVTGVGGDSKRHGQGERVPRGKRSGTCGRAGERQRDRGRERESAITPIVREEGMILEAQCVQRQLALRHSHEQAGRSVEDYSGNGIVICDVSWKKKAEKIRNGKITTENKILKPAKALQ